jgi:hypothetical protein
VDKLGHVRCRITNTSGAISCSTKFNTNLSTNSKNDILGCSECLSPDLRPGDYYLDNGAIDLRAELEPWTMLNMAVICKAVCDEFLADLYASTKFIFASPQSVHEFLSATPSHYAQRIRWIRLEYRSNLCGFRRPQVYLDRVRIHCKYIVKRMYAILEPISAKMTSLKEIQIRSDFIPEYYAWELDGGKGMAEWKQLCCKSNRNQSIRLKCIVQGNSIKPESLQSLFSGSGMEGEVIHEGDNFHKQDCD